MKRIDAARKMAEWMQIMQQLDDSEFAILLNAVMSVSAQRANMAPADHAEYLASEARAASSTTGLADDRALIGEFWNWDTGNVA